MKKRLTFGLLSIALAQSLYGVDATNWWELDKANNPPEGAPTINDPLEIFEDSTLSITTTANPQNGLDSYNGNIELNHDLKINVNVGQQLNEDQSTAIYRLNGQNVRNISGNGKLSILIDTPNPALYAKSVFNIDRSTLIINSKVSITTTQDSNIFSIFRAGTNSTFEFKDDLIIDLSQARGSFSTPQYFGRKVVFDNSGVVHINPDNKLESIIQITGDISSFGGSRLTMNLMNSQSFYKGVFNISNTSRNELKFEHGSRGEIELNFRDTPQFSLSLGDYSTVKLNANIISANGGLFAVLVDKSYLYANFTYNTGAEEFTPRGDITLNNGGIWFLESNSIINQLSINNPKDFINNENLKGLKNLSVLDMRFEQQGRNFRNPIIMTEENRYKLQATEVKGNNGVFRIVGILNREGWTRQVNEATQELTETIATDQIIANRIFNTHYMQVFWNATNFDKGLLNQNLEKDKIIVAKQSSPAGGSDFVGVVTPIGIYNYITNLKKEEIFDADNAPSGWQWIVSNVQRADNSYLSRLLDSLFQSQYRIFKMESDTFNLRMGELRDMQRVHGVWLRTKYGRFGSKSTSQTTPSWDEYTSIWLGYDQNFYVLGGKNFLGFALNTTAFRNHGIAEDEDKSGESYYASSRSYGISVYDTYIFDNGLYLDALAKYYFTDNELAIRSEVLNGNSPEFFTHAFLGSLEIGKKFRLPIKTYDFDKSFYYLRPELQFTFGFVSGTNWDFIDWSNQLVKAKLDFNIPANFRAGLMFGREFNKPYIKGDVYLGTSFEYDVNTGGDLRLEDFIDKMTLTHKGNFNWRINAGTNLILNQYWRIYFDIDTSFFGHINSTFTINGGVRINFGQLHPVMPYITPNAEDMDFGNYPAYRRTIPEVQNYETQGILDNYNGKKKRKTYSPPIKIKQRPFGGETKYTQPPHYKISPKVQEKPKENPIFVDNPSTIPLPQKNYTRDTNMPISPIQHDKQNRSLETIKNNINQGFEQ